MFVGPDTLFDSHRSHRLGIQREVVVFAFARQQLCDVLGQS
jgi:hypothetical protein